MSVNEAIRSEACNKKSFIKCVSNYGFEKTEYSDEDCKVAIKANTYNSGMCS